jgi:hypothetical protein
MFILLDARAPDQARKNLSSIGNVIDFKTHGICYDAISGHPDIFLFQHPGGYVVAPNLPYRYKEILLEQSLPVKEGSLPVGISYPKTAYYNALYSTFGILHNKNITDCEVKATSTEMIHCQQGYARCTTIQLGDTFFTSDKGIERTLLAKSLKVFFVDPQNIVLQGFNNGFFGGCCGIWEKKIYFCGALSEYYFSRSLIAAIESQGYKIVELYNGPLVDVGGIFFISQQ